MPYNNTPIAPSKEVSGQVSLPLARVQKIINADPERLHTSKNAAFAIALATELFIQHLSTTTHNVVKAETQKKPRRNVQYRDVATAVAKTDSLEFLVDVVPKTVLYKEVRKKMEERREKEGGEGGNVLERLMANGKKAAAAAAEKEKEKEKAEEMVDEAGGEDAAETEGGAEAMDVDQEGEETEDAEDAPGTPAVEVEDSEPEKDDAAMQIEMEMRGPGPKATDVAPATPSPAAHRPTRSSGFTAINGAK